MENIPELIDKFKIPIALSLVGVVLIIGGIFTSGSNKPREFPKESIVSADSSTQITIDVSGAVKVPGVYKLKEGSRITDAVSSAGGFTEDANKLFVSKYLNMAQKVSDGSKIYIPRVGEKDTDLAVSTNVAGASTEIKTININTSSQAQIESLPGVGPATAAKIINGRPYQQVEDLLNKKIVGKAVFEKIKNSVVLY